MGVEVVYPSIWEVKVGSGPRHLKFKKSISHSVVILASEPDAMLITLLPNFLVNF